MTPPHRKSEPARKRPSSAHKSQQPRLPGAVLLYYRQGAGKHVVCLPVRRATAVAVRLARYNPEHRQRLTDAVKRHRGHPLRQMTEVCCIMCNSRQKVKLSACTCDFDKPAGAACDHSLADLYPAPTVLLQLGLAEYPRRINAIEGTVTTDDAAGRPAGTYALLKSFDTNE
jgi:hypothetical protein